MRNTIQIRWMRGPVCWVLFGLLGLLWAGGAWAQPPRAVGVVYDDSQSMQNGARWPAANYALQVLLALLTEGDVVQISRLSGTTQLLTVPGGVNAQLHQLQQEPQPNVGTPYRPVMQTIDWLAKTGAADKWLLVLHDGDFQDIPIHEARAQIETVVRPKGIRVVFVPIEAPSGGDTAALWSGHATVLRADKAIQVPSHMEEIAALLTGRDVSGLDIRVQDSGLSVSSDFPLRGLVVLTQGDGRAAVTSATAGNQSMRMRTHSINRRTPHPDVPAAAQVAHLRLDGSISSGQAVAQIRFSGDPATQRYKVLAEVAARMTVVVQDSAGQRLTPDAQGRYAVCEGEQARVLTRLVGDNSQPLTQGRSDLDRFAVGHEGGDPNSPLVSVFDSQQQAFVARLPVPQEVRLNPFARYPGYFHFSAQPLVLVPKSCSKLVQIKPVVGADSTSVWSADVDRLDQAPPLRFRVLVDGQPATAEQLADWRWTNGTEGLWAVTPEKDELVVRPVPGCCALFWSRPWAHSGSIGLTLDTGNTRDKVELLPPMAYSINLPDDPLRRYGWLYACPVLAAAALAALAWYLWRVLVVKERFGRRACLHIEVHQRRRREPLVRGSELLSHWLWPARRETKRVEGLRFVAVGRGGSVVRIDGSTLGSQYEVEGWDYDEGLAERKRPQPDARLSHMTLVQRRSAQARGRQAFDMRMQYSRDGTGPNWNA